MCVVEVKYKEAIAKKIIVEFQGVVNLTDALIKFEIL